MIKITVGKYSSRNVYRKLRQVLSIQTLCKNGESYSLCPKCKEGKMEITTTYLNHNGILINLKETNKAAYKKQSIATGIIKMQTKRL